MSSRQDLTRQIDFRRWALDKARFEGVLSLAELPRTRAAVAAGSGEEVAVTVGLEEDGQRRVLLSGWVRAVLALPCQRCLEVTEVPMDIGIGGMVVTSDRAAAEVPREHEPILATGEMLDLRGLVDDELLLALPMTVQCDRAGCRAAYDKTSPEAQAPVAKANPFAALASLKAGDDESR